MAQTSRPQGGILLCNRSAGQILLTGEGCSELTLWCEMDPKSSVCFSSIGEDSAMLCLNRRVRLCRATLEPQERRVPYDPDRSVEENLLHSAAEWIGEELKKQAKESERQ